MADSTARRSTVLSLAGLALAMALLFATRAADAGAGCELLTTEVVAGSGSISVTPDSSGGCAFHQYSTGYMITVSPKPASGYVWSGWTGTDNDTSPTTNVTMTSDRHITVSFSENCHTLTANVVGGGGSISASPGSAGGCPTGQYPSGYVVTLSAIPNSGYVWASWSGTDNDTTATTNVTMNGDTSVTATFAGNCNSLTASVAGTGGTIAITPNSAGGCPSGRYNAGYVVTVSANPSPGYEWSYWSGTDDDTVRATTVTMNGDKSIVAGFSGNCYALTAQVGGGNGSIAVTPASAGGCPTGQYSGGYVVFLSANPAGGHEWTAWSGTDNDNVRATTVTMTSAKTVTAYFGPAGSTPPPTPTATNTPPPTPTRTPTPPPSPTPTNTPAQPATPTDTPPPGSTPTSSPTPTDTPPPGSTPTSSPTPTNTAPPGSTATSSPTPTNTSLPPQPTSTPVVGGLAGDANCDGRTNAVDAALVLQVSAGLLGVLPCQREGDIVGDGIVNALDAAVILQIAASLL